MADQIWYLSVGNQRKEGLFSEDDIKAMIQKGEVSPRDLVWKEGMDTWKPVLDVEPFIAVKPFCLGGVIAGKLELVIPLQLQPKRFSSSGPGTSLE